MKPLKILFLGICIILLSCTGDELANGGQDIFTDWSLDIKDEHYEDKKYVTPPEWIIGRWYAEINDYPRLVEFTSYDVLTYVINGVSSLNKRLNKIIYGEHEYFFIEEKATDTTYFFNIEKNSFGVFSNPIYNTLYKKISNDTIVYILTDKNNDTINGPIKYGRRD